jgi:hypothetical protein
MDEFTPQRHETWRRAYRAMRTAPLHRVITSVDYEGGETACQGRETAPVWDETYDEEFGSRVFDDPVYCSACISYTMDERTTREAGDSRD